MGRRRLPLLRSSARVLCFSFFLLPAGFRSLDLRIYTAGFFRLAPALNLPPFFFFLFFFLHGFFPSVTRASPQFSSVDVDRAHVAPSLHARPMLLCWLFVPPDTPYCSKFRLGVWGVGCSVRNSAPCFVPFSFRYFEPRLSVFVGLPEGMFFRTSTFSFSYTVQASVTSSFFPPMWSSSPLRFIIVFWAPPHVLFALVVGLKYVFSSNTPGSFLFFLSLLFFVVSSTSLLFYFPSPPPIFSTRPKNPNLFPVASD